MLGSLAAKRDALEAQRREAQAAIDKANTVWIDTQGFTQEKVFQLKRQSSFLFSDICARAAHLSGLQASTTRSSTCTASRSPRSEPTPSSSSSGAI